jgi:hypothetical protein
VASSTSTQSVSLEHPYKVPGIIAIIASLILIAFDLGFLVTCGSSHGICLDWGTNRVGTGALIAFFILFLFGIILIVYTGASTTLTSQTTRVAPPTPPPTPPPAPAVTVVAPAAAPPASTTSVTVNPPRSYP